MSGMKSTNDGLGRKSDVVQTLSHTVIKGNSNCSSWRDFSLGWPDRCELLAKHTDGSEVSAGLFAIVVHRAGFLVRMQRAPCRCLDSKDKHVYSHVKKSRHRRHCCASQDQRSALLSKPQRLLKPRSRPSNLASLLLRLANPILESSVQSRLVQRLNSLAGIVVHLAVQITWSAEQVQIAVAIALSRQSMRLSVPKRKTLRSFHSESIRIVSPWLESSVEEFGKSIDLVDEQLVAAERAGSFGVGPFGAGGAADDTTLCGPGEQVLESFEGLDPAAGAADDCFAVAGEEPV